MDFSSINVKIKRKKCYNPLYYHIELHRFPFDPQM